MSLDRGLVDFGFINDRLKFDIINDMKFVIVESGRKDWKGKYIKEVKMVKRSATSTR